jgi:hypothetical protein
MSEQGQIERVRLECGHEADVFPVDPRPVSCSDCAAARWAVKWAAEDHVLSFQEFQLVNSRLLPVYARTALIYARTLADIDLRRRAECSTLSLNEYMRSGQALIDHINGEVAALRVFFPEFIRACRDIGVYGRKLIRAMEEELGERCDELPTKLRRALRIEFSILCLPDTTEAALLGRTADEVLSRTVHYFDA